MNNQDWQKLDNFKNDIPDVRFCNKADRDAKVVAREYFEERKKTYRNTYLSHFYRQNQEAYEKILDYAGFSAHKASAGATGVADLPLWMSHKYTKPLTLFQRMAGSVTIDTYKNIVNAHTSTVSITNSSPILKTLLNILTLLSFR